MINITQSHDKENDILSFHWGNKKVDYSEEVKSSEGHDFVIDYDKKGRIVGIEMFDWDKGREAWENAREAWEAWKTREKAKE